MQDDDYDDPCDHESYDINTIDGRATCERCGESWYATDDQILSAIDAEAAYAQYQEGEERRQWWRDRWDTVKAFFRWRKPNHLVPDDDIPF